MTDLTQTPIQMNDGSTARLADFAGKPVLIVNVASKCGLTGQYEGLEALYRAHGGDLVVLGVPSIDFKGQEPGSDAEIKDFCRSTYDVTFPLAAKTPVTGADKHPIYAALIAAQPAAEGDGPWRDKLAGHGITANAAPELQWNFEKFLIGRDGRVAGRFAPDIAADDPRLTAAIDRALA